MLNEKYDEDKQQKVVEENRTIFGEEVAQLALDCYNSLPKAGKPTEGEWTTLAAIIQEDGDRKYVVALATGTKCVTGRDAKAPNVILDCHAESLCKRAFKRYIIGRIQNGSTFCDNSKFHLFISQLPCGVIERYKGAGNLEPKLCNLRKKPGRGELCLKPSCVDKIAKWNVLGLQGRQLISLLRRPVTLESITIGNCDQETKYDECCFISSLLQDLGHQEKKIKSNSSFKLNYVPNLYFASRFIVPAFTRKEKLRAAPAAVVCWKDSDIPQIEVVVQGVKQGVPKKHLTKYKLSICKESFKSDIESCSKNRSSLNELLKEEYVSIWNKLQKTDRFFGWGEQVNTLITGL